VGRAGILPAVTKGLEGSQELAPPNVWGSLSRMQKVTWREGEVAADAEFNNQKSKIGN
jgi:hypothetical protein